MNDSIKEAVLFDGRKVVGNTVVEIYKYKALATKDHFFKHYKTMQLRHYKNDRNSDYIKDDYLIVTYFKSLANEYQKGGK